MTGQFDAQGNLIGFERDHCFLAPTPITMWPRDPDLRPRADGTYDEARVLAATWTKPISEIAVGDVVLAYDDKGRLVPSPVLRTMTNHATHILDFWGTGVTLGHAYFCAGGRFEGSHVPLMDILRSDGAIMKADGTEIRAATGCEVGSEKDRLIQVVVDRAHGQVRLGTRVRYEGRDFSVADVLAANGVRATADGLVEPIDGSVAPVPFHWPFGTTLPRPEDYILARSDLTLEAIYAAGEWEQIKPRMAAPEGVVVPATDMGRNPNPLLQPARPEPNVPPAFAHMADAPRKSGRTLNRKQRKAQEARARKAAKATKRVMG